MYELSALVGWISSARRADGDPLYLTHFKLATTEPIDREDVEDVLHALRGSPMQALDLDCLLDDDPALLTIIADTFPELTSLTLHYRDHIDSDATIRGSPSWEYAQHLARFHCLKHIQWNIWHDYSSVNDPTTYMLQFFEDGFPSLCEWRKDYAQLDIESFEDGYTVPRCFASHCPTLERVTFLGSNAMVYQKSNTDGSWDVDSTRVDFANSSSIDPN